jgi:hypothetical protein
MTPSAEAKKGTKSRYSESRRNVHARPVALMNSSVA